MKQAGRIMVKGSLEFTKNREFDHNKTRHNKYVKLRVVHAPGIPGTFSPPPRVSDSDMQLGGGEYVPGACATRKFTYLVRDLWLKYQLKITLLSIFSSLQLRNSLHVGGTRSSARERNVNCKDKTIAIRQRVFSGWSLIYESSTTGMIKVELSLGIMGY